VTLPFLVLFLAALGVRAIPAPASPALDVPGRPDSTPWVAAAGSFVAVAWGASIDGKTDVFIAVSRDGGTTFRSPIKVNTVSGEARLGGELPPRVALLSKRGSPTPEIVVLWTARGTATEIKAARSNDGGRTFGAPRTLQSSGAAGDRGWPAVAFDDRGNVHAIWLDHRELAARRTPAAGHADHRNATAHDGVAMAQKSGLYYAAVNETPSSERELTKGVCYCCKTALAAGANGTLFAAWRHVYPGNLRDMAFTVSRDRGKTFSAPVRVSEDRWSVNGCPDDGPAIAPGPSGRVHVVWPTVMQGEEPEGALFYASTGDGRRFTPRVRVPTLGGKKAAHPQIVVTRAGRIFVAWDEYVNGRNIAAVREVTAHADGSATFGDVVTLSASGPASYPVLAATDKGLIAVWTTGTGDGSRVGVRTMAIP
jgi:hypothetical protein